MRSLSALSLLALGAAAQAAPILQLDGSNAASLTLSGSSVKGWKNAAGTQNFTPLDATLPAPTYVPNAINGRGAVDFNGTNPLIDLGFGGAYGDLTFFLVVAPRSNVGDYRAFLSDRVGDTNDYQTGFNLDMTGGSSTAFDRFNVEGTKGGGGGGTQLKTDASPFGAFQILSVTYSPATQLFVNGAAEGTVAYGAQSVPLSDMVVGGRYYKNSSTGGYDGFLDGRIAEVRIYDGALSTAARQGIESELNTKYFTPVPEPSALAALALPVLGLLRRRRTA